MGWEDPLEKGMAIHSSVLAWRIPWTEEPGGLYSPWVAKNWTLVNDEHFHLSLDADSPLDFAAPSCKWVQRGLSIFIGSFLWDGGGHISLY